MKFNINIRRNSGFTLIELLVVIAIIGLLASVVLISVRSAREKSKQTKLVEDMQSIVKKIEVTRDDQNKTLYQLTGSWCSDCFGCRGNGDLRGIADSHPCMQTMISVFQALGYDKVPIDPWGSPYLIDENEGEHDCDGTPDILYSAGENGIAMADSSDIKAYIPPFSCTNYNLNS